MKGKTALIIVSFLLVYTLSGVLAYQYLYSTRERLVQAGLIITSRTITVPDDYPTIQEAINHANEGDTVFVRNGTYYENVLVNKTVSLLGESKEATIIDGQSRGVTLEITSHNVTVMNFDIVRSSASGKGAIKLTSSNHCLICNNTVEVNAWDGIRLENSSSNIIKSNIVRQNVWDGIFLWLSSNNSVFSNTIVENGAYGIFASYGCINNSITQNAVLKNGWAGIVVGSSHEVGPSARRNLVSENLVTENSNNGYPLAGGIWLVYNSSDNVIRQNILTRNAIGVSTWLLAGEGNVFYHNNMFNNTVQAYMEGSCFLDNGYPSGGNHWSDYAGVDADKDGIGDTPHIIDSNNRDNYPLMQSWTPPDIEVASLTPHKTIVSPGYPLNMDINVQNQGNKIEGFNVTVYANATVVQRRYLILKGGGFTTITVSWNTTGLAEYQNYTVSACVEPLEGEIDIADNKVSDGIVTTAHLGDITGDGKVDIQDLARVSGAFASVRVSDPNDPRYGQYWHPTPCKSCPHTPNADITDDDKVDIQDLARTSKYFGWHR